MRNDKIQGQQSFYVTLEKCFYFSVYSLTLIYKPLTKAMSNVS